MGGSYERQWSGLLVLQNPPRKTSTRDEPGDESADEGWDEEQLTQNGRRYIKHGNVLIYQLFGDSDEFTCVIYGRDGFERYPYVVLHSIETQIFIG